MSTTKMNSFLQRMMKKNSSEELNVKTEVEEGQKLDTGRSGLAKGNWIKKLGSCSPTKYQVPGRSSAMRVLDRSGICNYETPKKTSRSPPLEMPDLESIIRDFEMGFLSPSKSDAPLDTSKQKNFVKKIVAAFEVKYKTYNDLRTAQESHEESKLDSTVTVATPKRRSAIFSSPFKSSSEEFRNLGKLEDSSFLRENGNRRSGVFFAPSTDSSVDSKGSRKSAIFGSPFRMSSDENKADEDSSNAIRKETDRRSGIFFASATDNSEDLNGSGRFGILSPYNRSESKDSSKQSAIYTSPVIQDSKDSGLDSPSLFKFDREESCKKGGFLLSPLNVPSLDDTKTMDSEDLDITLPEPEETIFLAGNGMQKTSTMINEFPTATSVSREPSGLDKTPKIVGAFLKKPIEVEDTSIDWIPITGKKLPRKRSLKKLLSSLTGKKSLQKRSKLFSSERNLNEEPRELQDSGYDEKSCSSSSLTSLVSITEVLLQQENSYAEPEKRTILRTFRSKNSLDEEEDEAFCDAYSTTSKQRRKLLLTEVPREDVKLDLGPSYPPSLKFVTMSLDRRTVSKKPPNPSPMYGPLTRIPKHPFLSDIPKHPFVALTKMDAPCESQDASNAPVIIKNDLYEVEFHRSCDDIRSPTSSRSSSSMESTYDVPRRFLSKSESEIPAVCRAAENIRPKETIYDVPRSRMVQRPRSSVYEDAVSLKRRSGHFGELAVPDFCAFYGDAEPHYATVKPRNNNRACINKGMLNSIQDLTSMENCSSF